MLTLKIKLRAPAALTNADTPHSPIQLNNNVHPVSRRFQQIIPRGAHDPRGRHTRRRQLGFDQSAPEAGQIGMTLRTARLTIRDKDGFSEELKSGG